MKSRSPKNHFGFALVAALLLSRFMVPAGQPAPELRAEPTHPRISFTPIRGATASATPTFTATLSRALRNTPSATSTHPPTGIAFTIGTPQLSNNQLFFQGAGCDPNRITIRVPAQPTAGIKVMVFFHRLHELATGKDSGWSEGLSMNTMGDGIYTLSVSGDKLIGDSGITKQAWTGYQFVMQTISGKLIHSTVYTDLSLLPCKQGALQSHTPTPTPTPTYTPIAEQPSRYLTPIFPYPPPIYKPPFLTPPFNRSPNFPNPIYR